MTSKPTRKPTSELTHLDQQGNARMVDVGDKPVSQRTARASGHVLMAPATLELIASGGHKKGDVLTVARLAGIQAAKQCAGLIPLCHPLMLTSIDVELILNSTAGRVEISATCGVSGQTGVEMEALTAVSVAALTVYDMCKAVDKDMVIGEIRLEEKQGGRSGHYQRQQSGA
ncbi:MAG: cyclic pyranopterin monophosphate synthase MoaC [Pseudohongiellaceae bacterium]